MSETFASKKTRAFMRRILSEKEIRLLTRRLRKVIGPMLGEGSSHCGLDIEDSVRFGAVATLLREKREARGMDFKAAAKALRVPQYRLQYIKNCNMKQLRVADLHAYIDLLGLNKWFARWCRTNSKLAARLTGNMSPEKSERAGESKT